MCPEESVRAEHPRASHRNSIRGHCDLYRNFIYAQFNKRSHPYLRDSHLRNSYLTLAGGQTATAMPSWRAGK